MTQIHGTPGDDDFQGSAEDEIFRPGAGEDSVNGGGGVDTVVMSGRAGDFLITASGAHILVQDKMGDDGDAGTDDLVDVDKLRFDNREWTVATTDFDVRTKPVSTTDEPKVQVIPLSAGGHVEVRYESAWFSEDEIDWTLEESIVMRLYDEAGNPKGGDILVDNSVIVDPYERRYLWIDDVLSLPSGGFAIAFSSADRYQDNFYAYARIFDGSGAPVMSLSLDDAEDSGDIYYYAVRLTALPEGGMLFYGYNWRTQSESLMRVAGDGSGKTSLLVEANEFLSPVVMNDGRLMIIRAVGTTGSERLEQIFLDSHLEPLGEPIIIPVDRPGTSLSPDLTRLMNGNFVLVWQGIDASGQGIYARFLDAEGKPAGDVFRVNSQTEGDQTSPVVQADANGGFTVFWDYSRWSRSFDAEGRPVANLGVTLTGSNQADDFRLGSDDQAPFVVAGGAGSDTYRLESGENIRIIEATGEGTDTIITHKSYTLPQGVENLQMEGGGLLVGSGNELNNLITGGSSRGGEGNDVLVGGGTHDVLAGGYGNDRLFGDSGDDELSGDSGADTLFGGDGHDELNGGSGADTLSGGRGDDYYFVDGVSDRVEELAGEGEDTIETSVTLVLPEEVENGVVGWSYGHVTLTGNRGSNQLRVGDDYAFFSDGATLQGMDGDDVLLGGDGDDVLEGGNGRDDLSGGDGWYDGYDHLLGGDGDDILRGGDGDVDVLEGGAGNDSYQISDWDTAQIVEGVGQGIDTIWSRWGSVTTLMDNVENLVLVSGGYATGNALNNILTGNAWANNLDGQAGRDRLIGGGGDDRYVVDQSGDNIIEFVGEGRDTVESAVNWVLGEALENLELTGLALRGTGNSTANDIAGNAEGNVLQGLGGNDNLWGRGGNDVLIGGEGLDRFWGGKGNDTYIIDNRYEQIVESGGEGLDQVYATCTLTLADNVENLMLKGAGALSGTGNRLANRLKGNDGKNRLDGGQGADWLAGGKGNDQYLVDNARDTVVEYTGNGTDTVISSVSFVLGRGLENLDLMGERNLSGKGNALANRLKGNAGDNKLSGGAGNDIYIMTRSGGADVIVENDKTLGNRDVLLFDDNTIGRDQLWFRRVGKSLEVSIIGTEDRMVIRDWFRGSAHHVERIRTANGDVLGHQQVGRLVAAMASLTPPPVGQTTLSAVQHAQLDAVIAASWT